MAATSMAKFCATDAIYKDVLCWWGLLSLILLVLVLIGLIVGFSLYCKQHLRTVRKNEYLLSYFNNAPYLAV